MIGRVPRPVTGFPPVWRPDCRVLVLGSMPGERSLRVARYYGNPQNAFWWIAGELFGAAPELDYEARLEALLESGVALWDVCRSCRRRGSSDAAIRDAVPNAIPELVERSPRLRTIACNGGTAHDLLRRLVPELPAELEVLRLPSTSPAYTGMSRAAKLAAWREGLRRALAPGT